MSLTSFVRKGNPEVMKKEMQNIFTVVVHKVNKVQFPMSFAVLINALKRQGIESTLFDLALFPIDERERRFREMLPDEAAIYGFSIIAGNRHMENTDHLANIIKEKNPDNIVIYGGPLPSAIPELMLRRCACDYVVHGQGEIVLAELITALRSGETRPDIPGVFFLQNDMMVGEKQKDLKRLERLTDSDFSQFDMEHYIDYLKETDQAWEVMASRGCWADCTFCYKFMGNGLAFRSADSILDEIEFFIKEHGFKKIYFVDENFFQVKKYFREFIKRKQQRRLDFEFIALSRIDAIDDELIKFGIDNGLVHMTTGVESPSEQALKKMNKRLSMATIENGLEILRKNNVSVLVALIVGFEWDTVEDFENMIDFIRRNQLEKRVKLSYLTPLPATALFTEAVEKGYIVDEYEYIRNLGDLYWERHINMTSLPDETLDYYFKKITDIGQKDVVYPKQEKYLSQIRKIH